MRTRDLATCRDCGGQIRWAHTPKLRRVPLDPDPDVAGDYRIDRSELGHETAIRVEGLTRVAHLARNVPLYRHHRKTCPASRQRRGA